MRPAWRTSASGWRISGGIFDFDEKKNRLTEVNSALEAPDIWNDAAAALELGKEKRALDNVVGTIEQLTGSLSDTRDLYEMAVAENDDATLEELERESLGIEKGVEKLEFRRMFSNPADPGPYLCIDDLGFCVDCRDIVFSAAGPFFGFYVSGFVETVCAQACLLVCFAACHDGGFLSAPARADANRSDRQRLGEFEYQDVSNTA